MQLYVAGKKNIQRVKEEAVKRQKKRREEEEKERVRK